MSKTKIYGKRDPRAQDKAGGFFSLHMEHLTAEDLHGKGDIAMELAHRDMVIDRRQKRINMLEQQKVIYALALDKLARLGNGNNYGNSIGNDIARRALEEAELITPYLPDPPEECTCPTCEYEPIWNHSSYQNGEGDCRWPCPPCLDKFKNKVKLDKLFKCPAWTAKKEPGE